MEFVIGLLIGVILTLAWVRVTHAQLKQRNQ